MTCGCGRVALGAAGLAIGGAGLEAGPDLEDIAEGALLDAAVAGRGAGAGGFTAMVGAAGRGLDV
jgi:hypothetical protein